jgi:hypothetical protein
MFHVNPQTGEAGKCSAKQGKCPFGGMNVHFTTPEAARESFEKSMEGEQHKAVTKATSGVDGRKVRGTWADLEIYRSRIGSNDEVFVHTQGKIAIINGDTGRMSVFKNGTRASTSGTADDLRAGRGSWKLVKTRLQNLLSAEDYKRNFVDKTSTSTVPTSPQSKTLSSAPIADPRAVANAIAGFPVNSQLDASKSGELQPVYEGSHSSYNRASILPVSEKANPHRDFKTSQWLTGWNYTKKDGTKEVSTFEVWEGKSESGNKVYKAVTTSGDKINKLGSKSWFQHDQTQQNMGNEWTMIGAFKAEEGGEAIGEIPDRKIPIYTYK